jgi:hypothetical protein
MTYPCNGKYNKPNTILDSHSSVEDSHFLGYNTVSTENGDHRLLQNVSIQLPIGITLYPKGHESSTPQTANIVTIYLQNEQSLLQKNRDRDQT